MDEIKIEKIDDEFVAEKIEEPKQEGLPQPEIEKVTSEPEIQKSIPKKFIYLVAAIILIFLALLAFNPLKNHFFPPTAQVITIDELFYKNLQGELPEEEGYIYNGFSFVLLDGLWYTEVQHENKIFQIPLHFGPRDLDDINITGQLDESFDQYNAIYITFDPLVTSDYISVAIGEFTQNLAVAINRQPIGACDKNETEACKTRPIINCTNTDRPVVYFLQEPGPKIELKGNCIILQGHEYDVVKAADRLLLQWYGVIS